MRHDGLLILNCARNLMDLLLHSLRGARRRRREGTKIREEWIGTKMNRNERNGHKFHCDVWLVRKIILEMLEIRKTMLLSAYVFNTSSFRPSFILVSRISENQL